MNNISIPALHCYLRKEFFYDQQKGHGEFEEVYAFGATSLMGWATTFTVMSTRGVQFTRIPISALVTIEHEPHLTLDQLQIWDCFSYNMTCVQYDFLKSSRARVFMKDGSVHYGTYKCTFDWIPDMIGGKDTSVAEVPEGHKTGHLIELDCGCFTIQPNNRIYWANPDWVVNPLRNDERPDYQVNTHKWSCETSPKWTTEDNDDFFYAYKNVKLDKDEK